MLQLKLSCALENLRLSGTSNTSSTSLLSDYEKFRRSVEILRGFLGTDERSGSQLGSLAVLERRSCVV